MVIQGITTISNEVLLKIAVQAAREIDGIAQIGASSAARSIAKMFGRGQTSNTGIDVNPGETGSGMTSFNFTLSVEFGYSIPDVVRDLRDTISKRVKEMTGLAVNNIDVYVEDIIDTSQQNKSTIPLIDKLRGQSKDEEEEKQEAQDKTRLPVR